MSVPEQESAELYLSRAQRSRTIESSYTFRFYLSDLKSCVHLAPVLLAVRALEDCRRIDRADF